MTNLQILLNCLEVNQATKDDAILEYFIDQDRSDFTVGKIEYKVLDAYEVKELLKTELEEELDEFKRANNRNFPDVIDAIYFPDVIDSMVSDRTELDLTSLEYVDDCQGMFIFQNND